MYFCKWCKIQLLKRNLQSTPTFNSWATAFYMCVNDLPLCSKLKQCFMQMILFNLSVGVALNVRFTTNGICAKNNPYIYVARTSNNKVISSGDLYCCFLPQCEALRTCRSGFEIATIPMCLSCTPVCLPFKIRLVINYLKYLNGCPNKLCILF